VVRLLLRAGVNPNIVSTDGKRATPLHIATQNGHLAILEALIELGANVNHIVDRGWTLLMMATARGHIDIVRALLAAGADPLIAITEAGPFNGSTALNVAKALNHSAIIALLEARLAELAAAGSP
jgi:ankyrin repeat protein